MENGALSTIIKQNKFGPFPESLVAVYIQQVLQVRCVRTLCALCAPCLCALCVHSVCVFECLCVDRVVLGVWGAGNCWRH